MKKTTIVIEGDFDLSWEDEVEGKLGTQYLECVEQVSSTKKPLNLDDPEMWPVQHNEQGTITELANIQALGLYLDGITHHPTATPWIWDSALDHYQRQIAVSEISGKPGDPIPPPLREEITTAKAADAQVLEFLQVIDDASGDPVVFRIGTDPVDFVDPIVVWGGKEFHSDRPPFFQLELYLAYKLLPQNVAEPMWSYGYNTDWKSGSERVWARMVPAIHAGKTPSDIHVTWINRPQ